MSDKPIKRAKDRKVGIRVAGIGNIAHESIDIVDISRSKPRRVEMCQYRRRMNEISIMIMMVVIVSIPKVRARVREPRIRHKTLPTRFINEGNLLLIILEHVHRRLEFPKTCRCK